jgi:surface polysaccharide O-acyltransferase-like enzyme
MTALIYFGEMLVASLLAILLLTISPFGLSSDATLFAAGIVAWTFAEYVVHRFVLHGLLPTQHGLHDAAPTQQSSLFFGRYGPVSHESI